MWREEEVMNFRFEINKRELVVFEEFMTKTLQEEIEKAYGRTLNRLGRGCVNSIKRRLGKSEDPDDRTLLGSGIVYAPRTAKRILQLNPVRIVIGTGSSRKRHFLSSQLVGKPFQVTLTDQKGGKVTLIASRNKDTKHVDAETASMPRYFKSGSFKGFKWESHQSFNGYRNTALPITILSPTSLNDTQAFKFKRMVEEYAEANHDKFFEQEYGKAVKRAKR